MGVIIRLVLFVIGALGLVFVGLNTASGLGVDTQALMMKLGETPGGIASHMSMHFAAGLDMLGGVIAGTQGEAAAEAEKPSVLVSYGPDVIAAVVSALMMMFSMRK